MPPIILSMILVLFAAAFFLLMLLKMQLANAPGITRPIRNSREYISVSPWTRKKGYFEWLFGPPNIERVLANLPATLRTLDVSATDITGLPDNLPPGLVKLVAKECKNLEAIDHLPDTLEHLDLWGCEKLARLPGQLPPSLQEMTVAGAAITELPRLPDSLRSLDARGCRNLVRMSDQWPLFMGHEPGRPKIIRFRPDPREAPYQRGNLHWLNLSNTPVLLTLSDNLPEGVLKQLNQYGCSGWRHNSLLHATQYANGRSEPDMFVVG
jgi:Leucine Rich Repeat.